MRISCSDSSRNAPTSPTRSWVARASLRTRRPNRTIGTTTSGTPASTSSVSFALVSVSITRPPIISRKLRIAIDALDPITVSSIVVSLMSREITSPVRVASKNAGGRSSRWSNTVAAQVGRDALAEPRHVVEPHVRRTGHDDDDAEHQRQHAIELAGVGRGKSAIDDELQSLSDGQHRGGGDDEADRSEDDLAPIRPQEAARRARPSSAR